MANQRMEVRSSKVIKASAEQVWDALVNPEKTKLYMFGCRANSDWIPGHPLEWEAVVDGQKVVYVTGRVVTFNPPHELTYTVFDPNQQMEDIPANHLTVTCTLATEGDHTRLTIVQDGFEDAANGKARYEEVSHNGLGWDPILDKIALLTEGENH